MMTKKNKVKKVLFNFSFIFGVIILVVLLTTVYLKQVQTTEQKRVDQVVRESSIQLTALIKERIHNDMTYIEGVGNCLGASDAPITSPETLRSMKSHKDVNRAFKSITIATLDGNLYDYDGVIIDNISTSRYFQEAKNGHTAISDLEQSSDGNKKIISLAAPIRKEGEIIGVVKGRFLMSELVEFLSADFFDGQGYSYVADTAGNIFVMSDNRRANPEFKSIYDGLKLTPPIPSNKLDQMIRNMKTGKEGQIVYGCQNEQRTMSYMPIGINDWYLLSVLPNKIVASRAMQIAKQVLLLTVGFLIIIELFLFYVNHQRKKNQKSIQDMHEEILTIFNNIPGGIFKCLVDDGFTVIGANDGFYKILGLTKEEFQEHYSNQIANIIYACDFDGLKRSIVTQSKKNKFVTNEVQLFPVNEEKRWFLMNGAFVRLPSGEDVIYGSFTDISELKDTQNQLQEEKQRYDIIVTQTRDIIFEWNPVDKMISHSKNFQKTFGYQLISDDFPQRFLHEHLIHQDDESIFLDLYHKMQSGDISSTAEFRIKKSDGSFLWCRVSSTAVHDKDGRISRVVGVIEDIDAAKKELSKVIEIAQHDPLTGLYNKGTTEYLMKQYISTSREPAVLLMIDIDNFKQVNDSLGHKSGDVVLIGIANKLKELFQETDIVGRIGGDEFVALLNGWKLGYELEHKLAEIAAVFRVSFEQIDVKCDITCSIGVALFPKDGTTFSELFHKADMALYYVKQNGKDSYLIYNEEIIVKND
ncbi:MAG: diguanylate cyclase [Lachnospiraceae bacterium]